MKFLLLLLTLTLTISAVPARAAWNEMIGDREFFAALDQIQPAMRPIVQAAERGDFARARQLFADHLRTREVRYFFDPRVVDRSVKHKREDADKVLEGRIWQVYYEHQFPSGEVDWVSNPTRDNPKQAYTGEWTWQLNRMYFWPNLGRTYWATGDEKYARAWARQLRGWIDQATQDSDEVRGQTWRTIEAGLRMSFYWPDSFLRFANSPSVSDDLLVDYAKVALMHGRLLSTNIPNTPNWVAMTMDGLFTLAGVFPEFEASKAWRAQAINKTDTLLRDTFLPDGTHMELSPMYHTITQESLFGLYRKARTFGYEDEVPADFLPRFERTYDYFLKMAAPGGGMPKTNDTVGTRADGVLRNASERFPNRADFRYVATGGKEGVKPDFTSVLMPYSGFAAMRSGWDADDNMLFFDVGPHGTRSHAHRDTLQVLLWSHGREVIFDPGGGEYERSKWRSYAGSTYSHSLIFVDGGQQQPRPKAPENLTSPIDVKWASDQRHDYAAGIYAEPYGDAKTPQVKWQRRVFFLKPGIYVVADDLTNLDGLDHDIELRWHLDSAQIARDEKLGLVATGDEKQPNLAVVDLLKSGDSTNVVSGQEEPFLLGWAVDKGKRRPATTIQMLKKGRDARFVTLLQPLQSGEKSAVTRVEQQDERRFRVHYNDGRTLSVDTGATSDDKLAVAWTNG